MKTFTYRMKDDVYEELESLSALLKVSKTQVLDNLIRFEYNKFESDPEVKKALGLLSELQALTDKYTSGQ